ncbi:MAG: hypothetical protein F6K28_47795, partial [Microcoleus sp. SIO2G3]|nr:hypothetical protein [Microcoleus sp. SIO2G3]
MAISQASPVLPIMNESSNFLQPTSTIESVSPLLLLQQIMAASVGQGDRWLDGLVQQLAQA